MPTHSRPSTGLGENVSHETLWDYYCNTPTILSWHEDVPGNINSVLEQDWAKKGDRDYRKDFLQLYENSYKRTRKHGESYTKPIHEPDDNENPPKKDIHSAFLVSSDEGLTVEYRAVEKSAEMLCESKTSAGPDYANVPEGLFCRSKSFPEVCFRVLCHVLC